MSDFKLYTPCNWFDVEKLCSDDVQYHDKKNLLVDYESFDQLTQTNKELEQARLDEMALKAKAREQRDEMTAKVKELEEKLEESEKRRKALIDVGVELEAEVKALKADRDFNPHTNPECDHQCETTAHYDYVSCNRCG